MSKNDYNQNLNLNSEKKIKHKKYFNIEKLSFKIYSLVNLLLFLSLLITLTIIKNQNLYQFFKLTPAVNHNWTYYSLKIALIVIILLIVINNLLTISIIFNNKWFTNIKSNFSTSILVTIFSFNFYLLIYHFYLIKNKKKQKGFNKNSTWIKFKNNFGLKKWLTKDYVLIALFCALTITFTYIEENLLPHLPFGGGVGLKYIPLIFISFSTSFLAGWLTGFTSCLIALLFIPASNIINPWSFILDYFLPMTTPAIVAFLPFKINQEKTIFTYINYFLHCFIVLFIIWIWQILSGYLVWTKLYRDEVWEGYNPMLYSLVYNFIHVFIFTYPLLQIITPILYKNLGTHFLNKY